MITIYKTTEGAGKRAIGYLPLTKEQALERIKQVADDMGWIWKANQHSVTILYKPSGDKATYSAVEEKITNFAESQ